MHVTSPTNTSGVWYRRHAHRPWSSIACGVLAGAIAVVMAACGAAPVESTSAPADLVDHDGVGHDDDNQPGEWVTLFDGNSVEHWRGFRRDDFPDDGWRIDAGTLTPRVDGTVVDLVTRERFQDYDLELEWRVAPNGNSGIFVHVHEDHPEVWHTGLELQVLDDERHPDGTVAETSAGSIYNLVAPTDKRLRPAGEWNAARITVRGPSVAFSLNGQQILTVDVRDDAFLIGCVPAASQTCPTLADATTATWRCSTRASVR